MDAIMVRLEVDTTFMELKLTDLFLAHLFITERRSNTCTEMIDDDDKYTIYQTRVRSDGLIRQFDFTCSQQQNIFL